MRAAAERHVGRAAADAPARSVQPVLDVSAEDAVLPRHAPCGPEARGVHTEEDIGGRHSARAAAGEFQVGDDAGELGVLHRHAPVRGADEPRHACRGADGGGGHGQRRVVGAVQAVLPVRVLWPDGPALRPHPVVVLLCRAVRRGLVLGAGDLRVRLLRRAVRVRGQLRRWVQHLRRVQLRHADTDGVGRAEGVPLRLRPRTGGAVQRRRRAPRPRSAGAVPGVAGVGRLRRGLLILPPTDADHHGVPDTGRAEQHVGVLHDGAAVGADVLHCDALRHQRRRAAAGYLGVGVFGGHGGGHGDGDHAAAAHGVRSAAVGVPQRHGPLRLPDRAGDRDPGHVLQLHGVRKRDAADGGADVQRRRDHDAGGVGDPIERVPRVRAQWRRRQRGHPRERAAALVRGALRRQHRRVHARFLLIERFINS